MGDLFGERDAALMARPAYAVPAATAAAAASFPRGEPVWEGDERPWYASFTRWAGTFIYGAITLWVIRLIIMDWRYVGWEPFMVVMVAMAVGVPAGAAYVCWRWPRAGFAIFIVIPSIFLCGLFTCASRVGLFR